MGGFLANGRLTRAAILHKATRTLREVDSGASGWLFAAGASLTDMRDHCYIGPDTDIDPPAAPTETESNGDTEQPRKGRPPRNRPAD